MSIIGSIVKKSLELKKRVSRTKGSPLQQQHKTLLKLLIKAENTQFGRQFNFSSILNKSANANPGDKSFYQAYKQQVPIFTYNDMANQYWNRARAGEEDVAWPGKIKFWALSSGTSEASTKHIPITKDLIEVNKKTSVRQILTLAHFNLPPSLFTTGVLMLGGSTKLNNHGHYYDGDLSGIQAKNIPTWFANFYKPGKRIARISDWETKLDEITRQAGNWNIGVIAGNPAWLQMLIERIVKHYKLNNIHDLWPNLTIFAHGGVSFEPYKKGFEKLLARPLIYFETYLASEGFIAYQAEPNRDMALVLDNGLFLEFIPYTEENFNGDGDLVSNPQTFMIDEVTEGEDYALLLSTVAGSWRYLIGDVVRITNKERAEIKIIGRTKHYISLCGEHLSMENMDKAMSEIMQRRNIVITEYAVAGCNYGDGGLFTHHWYIGTDDVINDKNALLAELDEELKLLNDDYAIERKGPLKNIEISILPINYFYQFMKDKLGKVGGQNKFPRVLKKIQLEKWNQYLEETGLASEQTLNRQ